MKRFFKKLVLAVLAFSLVTASAGYAQAAAPEAERMQSAVTLLEAILSGQYAEAEARFTPEMTSALNAQGGLQSAIESLLTSTGAVKSYGQPTLTPSQGMDVVILPIEFEHMALNAVVSTDAAGAVAGLMFQPIAAVEEATVPEGVIEQPVSVDAGTGYPLGGTLSLPDNASGPLPGIVLVWGSGMNGRDEVVGGNRIFAQLAHGLAQRGFAVLRFDKRTYQYPALWEQPGFSVKEEYMEDVLAAVSLMKADPQVDADQVFILGHSQGGMLAPRFVEAGADVAGLILMAGTPRKLSDILYDQEMNILRASAPALDTPEAQKAAQQYTAWKAEAEALYAMTEAEARAHAPLYMGAFPAYYLYEMNQYDALALLTAQQTPVLVLQGGKDMQVFPEADYGLYETALCDAPYAQLKLYPTLSHLFLPSAAANLSEAMLEYNAPAQIPEAVLDDIAGFAASVQ